MPFNNMFYPPYFPMKRNYFPVSNYNTNNTPEIESTETRNKAKKEKKSNLNNLFSFLNIDSDDLLILAILFFLYLEKCDNILLYGILILLLLDIDLDSIFNFII